MTSREQGLGFSLRDLTAVGDGTDVQPDPLPPPPDTVPPEQLDPFSPDFELEETSSQTRNEATNVLSCK